MKEILVALMVYASQQFPSLAIPEDSNLFISSLTGNKALTVEVVSKEELVSVAYEGEVPAGFDYDSNTTIGLYNHKNNTIYLSDIVDINTRFGKSVLLHEVVHYLQYQNGVYDSAQCVAENEKLAYKIQNSYLTEHNVDQLFSKQHIFFASLCYDHL